MSTLCGLRRLLLPPAELQLTQLCNFQNRNRNRKPILVFPKTEKPVLHKEPGFGNPNMDVYIGVPAIWLRLNRISLHHASRSVDDHEQTETGLALSSNSLLRA